jgi:hypothetical protein
MLRFLSLEDDLSPYIFYALQKPKPSSICQVLIHGANAAAKDAVHWDT